MLKRFIKTSIASCTANTLGLLVGHPLDTIKIRVQMASEKMTIAKCAANIMKREGPIALYKGLISPLMATMPYNSAIFAVNETLK